MKLVKFLVTLVSAYPQLGEISTSISRPPSTTVITSSTTPTTPPPVISALSPPQVSTPLIVNESLPPPRIQLRRLPSEIAGTTTIMQSDPILSRISVLPSNIPQEAIGVTPSGGIERVTVDANPNPNPLPSSKPSDTSNPPNPNPNPEISHGSAEGSNKTPIIVSVTVSIVVVLAIFLLALRNKICRKDTDSESESEVGGLGYNEKITSKAAICTEGGARKQTQEPDDQTFVSSTDSYLSDYYLEKEKLEKDDTVQGEKDGYISSHRRISICPVSPFSVDSSFFQLAGHTKEGMNQPPNSPLPAAPLVIAPQPDTVQFNGKIQIQIVENTFLETVYFE